MWEPRSDHKTSTFSLLWRFPLPGVIILLTILWCAGVYGKAGEKTQGPTGTFESPERAQIQTPQVGKTPLDLSTAIVKVAQETIPAVVHIEVTQRQEVANPLLPFEKDPLFRRFLGLPRDMPKKFKRELKGLGTGMIMDAEGHILTNNHVVAGATEIEVLLSDGDRYSARVIGTDPKTDLAVIQISAKESLPHVTFGDSDKMEVGEWVVAIGHPRGLDQTVTQGIISAKHRAGIMDPSSYQDFLQTDAAINPGNSGGPLLNLRGEVVGVNAVIVSQSGGFEGIGFAIPSNMALFVAGQLTSHGKVERGWLGVSVQDLSPELKKSLGVAENTRGAVIDEVFRGGPAEKAGLRKEDIVVAFGKKEVKDASTLRNDVAVSPIGEDVNVKVVRSGKEREFAVTIGNQEDAMKLLSASIKERLGAEVREVSSDEAVRYGLKPGEGVAVAWIDPAGPLGKAGFEIDDLLLEVNGQSIEGVDSLVSVMGTLTPHQKIAVLALDHRTGNRGYVEGVTQ